MSLRGDATVEQLIAASAVLGNHADRAKTLYRLVCRSSEWDFLWSPYVGHVPPHLFGLYDVPPSAPALIELQEHVLLSCTLPVLHQERGLYRELCNATFHCVYDATLNFYLLTGRGIPTPLQTLSLVAELARPKA